MESNTTALERLAPGPWCSGKHVAGGQRKKDLMYSLYRRKKLDPRQLHNRQAHAATRRHTRTTASTASPSSRCVHSLSSSRLPARRGSKTRHCATCHPTDCTLHEISSSKAPFRTHLIPSLPSLAFLLGEPRPSPMSFPVPLLPVILLSSSRCRSIPHHWRCLSDDDVRQWGSLELRCLLHSVS